MATGTAASRRSKIATRLDGLLSQLVTREYSFNLLMGVAIGIIGGYGAVGFRLAIEAVSHLFWAHAEPTYQVLLELPWYWRLSMPVLGALIVGPVIHFFASEAKGHGVPEVMAAVATKGGIIRGRVAAAKVIASAVTIGSGGSAGSEGPIVQIGSAIASKLGQLLRVSARRMKTFVGCGAAAGIAATFNAPVAGMLFALEIILGDFTVANISPIIVAAVTATAVSRFYLGDAPAFEVPGYALVSPVELLHYAVLGLAAALVAVAFTKTLHSTEVAYEKLKLPEWLKPVTGALVVGALGAFGLTHVYGVGYEFIEVALSGQLGLTLLIGLTIAKIVATSATLGSGGSGGILAPSLLLGAMVGGIVWHGAHFLTPDLVAANHGPYSLVGMAAVVGATTHAPLQAILILFELTGGYEVILPLMLSTVIAVIFASRLMEDSIYTVKLRHRGITLRRGQEVNVLRAIRVSDVMRSDPRTVQDNTRLRPLLDLVGESSAHSTLFVLDRKKQLMGHISFQELRQVLFDVEALEAVLVAADIANFDGVAVTSDDNLDLVMSLFAKLNLDEIAVVDSADNRELLASIHRTDVVDAYNHEILKRDLMGSVASSVTLAHKVGHAELAPGYSMAEVELPSAYAGKDLRALDLRNREGLELLLVRRRRTDIPGESESIVPTPDLVLEHGDVILVSGKQEAVERLARR